MRRGLALVVVLSLSACGGGADATSAASASTTSPTPASTTTAGGATAIVPSEGALNGPLDAAAIAAAQPATPPEATTGGEIISVAPGFRPDPIVRRGLGGGPVSADSIDESCRGFIQHEPTFLLKVDAALPDLRVLVHMEGDATLVIQLADGTVLCNDDSEGLDPMVAGAFPPGRHRVWVGTYSESAVGTAYTIGFTRQPTVSSGALDGMPTTP
jgi:hypothetical protein